MIMTQQIDGDYKTFTSGEAISPFRLVKIASGVVTMCDATEMPIGVSTRYTPDASPCSVKLITGRGTHKIEALLAVTAGASIYCCENGTVDDADPGSGLIVGIALEAATAQGDIIECVLCRCTT